MIPQPSLHPARGCAALLIALVAARGGAETVTRTLTVPGASVTVTASGAAEPKIEINSQAVEPGAERIAFLGVGTQPVSPDLARHLKLPKGLYLAVREVEPGSPADQAGLKEDDLLTHLDDQVLVNLEQLQALVRQRKAGETVTVKYLREGKPAEAKATLTEREVVPVAPAGRGRAWGASPLDPFWGGEPFGEAHREMRERLQRAFPGPALGLPHPGAGGVVEQHQSSRSSTMVNDEGTFTFREQNGDKHFRAEDRSGKVLFDGPVNTEEERGQVPEAVRGLLRSMDRGGDAPAPRRSGPRRGPASDQEI
jgi:hypothetical protein